MAMKLAWSSPHGVSLSEAYARVSVLLVNATTITAQVEFYVDEAARRAGDKVPLVRTPVDVPYSQDMPGGVLAYVYRQLKTIPGYGNAVDC
jgi:hypothetical protein